MAAENAVQKPAPHTATYAQLSRGQLDLGPISASRARRLGRPLRTAPIGGKLPRPGTFDCGSPLARRSDGKLLQQLLD